MRATIGKMMKNEFNWQTAEFPDNSSQLCPAFPFDVGDDGDDDSFLFPSFLQVFHQRTSHSSGLDCWHARALFLFFFPLILSSVEQLSSQHGFSKCMLEAECASHISACQLWEGGYGQMGSCMFSHMSRVHTMKQKPSAHRNGSRREDEMDALESQSTPGSLTVWC